MKKKVQAMLRVFGIIPSEFVALTCFYQERILAIDTQFVRKQF